MELIWASQLQSLGPFLTHRNGNCVTSHKPKVERVHNQHVEGGMKGLKNKECTEEDSWDKGRIYKTMKTEGKPANSHSTRSPAKQGPAYCHVNTPAFP